MQLFVGLGNPGPEYAGHRHNIGFMAMDAIAQRFDAAGWSRRFNGLATEITLTLPAIAPLRGESEKIILLKPQSFMNRSGQPVGEAMRFYKLTPTQVTVFHDELDLPLTKVRIKTGGGHGGHNGLRDIDAHIGKEYRRIRLGIDHPGHKDRVTGHVLSNFGKDERPLVDELLDDLARTTSLLAAGDDAGVMNKLVAHSQ